MYSFEHVMVLKSTQGSMLWHQCYLWPHLIWTDFLNIKYKEHYLSALSTYAVDILNYAEYCIETFEMCWLNNTLTLVYSLCLINCTGMEMFLSLCGVILVKQIDYCY